jgi:hypothetical protein
MLKLITSSTQIIHKFYTDTKKGDNAKRYSPLYIYGAEEETRTLTLLSTTPSIYRAKMQRYVIFKGLETQNHVFKHSAFLAYFTCAACVTFQSLSNWFYTAIYLSKR